MLANKSLLKINQTHMMGNNRVNIVAKQIQVAMAI